MRADTFTFEADDSTKIFVYRWLPDEGAGDKGLIHIAHGMAEHAGRYARAAGALVKAGWSVYANDHRGHGRTARWSSELGFFATEGGVRRVIRDLEQLVEHERRAHPGRPIVLLGHSMGATLVQAFLIEHGSEVQGAALSGTVGKPGALAAVGKVLARVERRRLGERGRSALLTAMSFGGYNRAFKPNRTAFDWLSRDEAEVDKYIADQRCGFTCTTSLWVDLLDALEDISRPDRLSQIPNDLPIYVFCGAEDPVGDRTRSVTPLLSDLRAAGLSHLSSRFYPGARHETLNETNRDEVVADLVAWLDAEVTRTA